MRHTVYCCWSLYKLKQHVVWWTTGIVDETVATVLRQSEGAIAPSPQ